MTETLIDLASEFGALSPEIVTHARVDIPPRQAMEDLRRQFPASFRPVFDARTATKTDYEAHKAKLLRDQARDQQKARNEAAMARIRASHAGKR